MQVQNRRTREIYPFKFHNQRDLARARLYDALWSVKDVRIVLKAPKKVYTAQKMQKERLEYKLYFS